MTALLNKRVEVISGEHKGLRFDAVTFENGKYFTEIDDEVAGFLPEELRETGGIVAERRRQELANRARRMPLWAVLAYVIAGAVLVVLVITAMGWWS